MRRVKLNIIISILVIAASLGSYGCTNKISNMDGDRIEEIPVIATDPDLDCDTGG